MDLRQVQKASLIQRMQMGMALSNCIELSQEDFNRKLKEIEESELFRKLSSPGEAKVIDVIPVRRYFTAYGARPETAHADEASPPPKATDDSDINALDIESIIEKYLKSADESLFNRIRQMGIELFCYYFLEGEGTDLEVAQLLDMPVNKVRPLRQIFDRVIIADILGLHDSIHSFNPDMQRTEIIAEISFVEDEPQIYFAYDRFRYKIDEDKLNNLLKAGRLSPDELKQFRGIRDTILTINSRYNILHEIIERATQIQKSYLLTMAPSDLNALEEKELADQIGVDPSWVCRLVKGKSSKRYIRSRNRLIPLRDLFISRRQLSRKKGVRLIKAILNDEKCGRARKKRLTDDDIRIILKEDFNFLISRRAVNNWRRELEEEG